jgi:hypothetical protein
MRGATNDGIVDASGVAHVVRIDDQNAGFHCFLRFLPGPSNLTIDYSALIRYADATNNHLSKAGFDHRFWKNA